jgi:glutathione S-transferase
MDTLTFFHAPQSRSTGILWLLEELEAPYETELVDIRKGAPESYRAVQPNKKVPAIQHNGVTVTERAAIAQYLAETFPAKGLAVPPGHPQRGQYLTWLVYCDSVFDPALAAKFMKWEYAPSNFSFGSFDDMVAHVERTLAAHPYAVGDRFTAVDTQLGSGLHWALNVMKAIPERPVLRDYLTRVTERPACKRAWAKDHA